tara:strand:+ start:138 stop:464 length:327 start_codon:yes stop_codon:yes gene_type:complete
MDYKRKEIKQYFDDFIDDQDAEWIEDNKDDLHHHAFNTDYYITGTYQAKQWLGDKVFDVIEHIREYEDSLFGKVSTDFSDAEKVVNMYAYIIGEEIVSEYVNKLEEVA